MSEERPVEPIQGSPAPPPPGPAPIQRRQTRFRVAAPLGGSIPKVIPAFPVSEGIAPMIAHADGYQAVEVAQSGLQTCVPSYLNCAARIFLTNQKLVVNDKFLKEVSLYHPDALDLYASFLFVYQSLRARAEVGQLSSAESTLLSDLLREYPPAALPVPGTMVDVLQTLTTTENPYSWLGNITPSLPTATSFSGPNKAYLLKDQLSLLYPNPMFLISQLVAHAARARPTEQTFPTDLLGFRFTSPGANNGNTHVPAHIRTDSAESAWLFTPHTRYPPLLTLRVAQAYHDSVLGSSAAPFYSSTILDLPNLNGITSTNQTTLATYIGVIDNEGISNRNVTYRRWPLQLANMAGTACKYITGSRFLNGIPTTGLGAFSHVSKLVTGTLLETRRPSVVQGGDAGVISLATYAKYHVTNLNATLNVRDPVANDLSIQYQMLTQTNINVELAKNGDDTMIQAPMPRIGPFWDYPIAEIGQEAAVANILLSHLPNFVKANPRRDSAE